MFPSASYSLSSSGFLALKDKWVLSAIWGNNSLTILLKNVIALLIYVKNWVYVKKDRNWNWMSWTYKSWCSFENGYFVTKKKSEHGLFTS